MCCCCYVVSISAKPAHATIQASKLSAKIWFLAASGLPMSEFGGCIYQKVNDNLETAVNLAWTAGSNGTRFGIAAKYQLDSSASISVSVLLVSPRKKLCLPTCLSAGVSNVLTVQWNVVGIRLWAKDQVIAVCVDFKPFNKTLYIVSTLFYIWYDKNKCFSLYDIAGSTICTI